MELNRRTHIIMSVLTVILSVLLAFLNFYEWYIVKIDGQTAGYPFDGEGPTAYYYKSAKLYSTVNFVWGIVFLFILLYTCWTILKGQKKMTLFSFITTIILLFAFIIQGQIES